MSSVLALLLPRKHDRFLSIRYSQNKTYGRFYHLSGTTNFWRPGIAIDCLCWSAIYRERERVE